MHSTCMGCAIILMFVCECCVQESSKHEWATPPIVPSVRWGINRTDLTLGDVRKWFGAIMLNLQMEASDSANNEGRC